MPRTPFIREDRWYVVRVHPGCEVLAAKHLEEQAYGAFAPTYTPEGKTRKGEPLPKRPLIPGYIMVQFDIAFDRWQPINSTRGVMHLLPQGRETPLPIPSSFVELLQARVQAGDFKPEELEDILNAYVAGLPVEIIGGPFAGFWGIVQKRQGRALKVLVNCFGRDTPVELGVEDLKRPKARPTSRPEREGPSS